MLHFITGRPGTGKSEYIFSRLRDALADGREVLLLVPEQQAVLWESRLATELPPSCQLHLEVTNFTRLANTVFRQYGGLSKPRIDDGGRSLILWRAMLSVWNMLEVYNRGIDGREDKNIPLLLTALGELKRNGITPEMAERAAGMLAEDEGAAGFAGRLADVSLIYSAYEELLHQEYSDRDDTMQALAAALETHPFFEGKAVFVDSFYSVTPPELRILRSAVCGAADFWISFACDKENSEELPFLRIRKFLGQMERIAAEAGQSPEWTVLQEDRRHATAGLRAVAADLFRYEKQEFSVEADACTDVTVFRCEDRYEESEAVAAWIENKVRAGCRYRDIAVVSRHMDSLRGILDTALQRHGIPCFIAEADPLSASPAVRLLTSLLAVEARGYDRRDLIRMIGTGLTPVSATEGDCFATYTETWNIRGRTMFWDSDHTAGGWSWNPDGYSTQVSPWGEICLREANRARDKLLPAVAAFSDIFQPLSEEKGAKRMAAVEDICRGMVIFAERIGLYARLTEQAEEAVRQGRREEGAKLAQVWQKICEALDKMVLFLGDVPMDAGRFSGLFSRVIASMEIGAIPTGVDEVLLGSADGIRFGQVRHVILTGAVEGEFPGNGTDTGFFRDSDRILLEGVGVTLHGSTEEYLAEEYWMFYRTAVSATESLTVFCPRTDAGEECVPSPGVKRILALTGRELIPWSSLSPKERIFHPAARISDKDPALRKLLEKHNDYEKAPYYAGLMDAGRDSTDPARIAAHFGERMYLTQSRLDKFSACPFRYWCQYGMALREMPKATVTSPDIGNFVHAILERFFRQTKDREYPLPPEETEQLTDSLVRSYLEQLGVAEDGRLGYLFVRLRRNVSVFLEVIMAEYAQGKFVPMAFEMPIGLPSKDETLSVPPLKLQTAEGLDVTLCGILDRVDHYKAEDGREYIRVVDYKTGRQKFSLEDVRKGIHVQLLVYLFSLWKGSRQSKEMPELYPAGAVYMQVRPGETASESMLTPEEARDRAVHTISRSGIWLQDEEILRAMDADLSGKYVPVTVKKDGGFSGLASLADLETFGALYGELCSVIEELAGEMARGKSYAVQESAAAKNSTCKYCEFASICRMRGNE